MSVETQLADWLERTTPEPPRLVTVEDVAPLVRQRHPRWQPLLAAALVLVVASVAVAILARSKHRQAAPVATQVVSSSQRTSPTSSRVHPSSSASAPAQKLPWGAEPVTGVKINEPIQSGLVSAGSALFGYSTGGALTRVDVRTGKVISVPVMRGDHASRPVVAAGQVWLAAAVDNSRIVVVGYNVTTLKVEHRVTLTDMHLVAGLAIAATAASGTTLYVGGGTEIAAIDANAGSQLRRWSVPTDRYTITAVAASVSTLFAATDNGGGFGYLLSFDADPQASTNSPVTLQKAPIGDLLVDRTGRWVTYELGNTQWAGFDAPSSARPVGVGGGNGMVSMTISGSTAWLTSPNQVVCADPTTGHERARWLRPPHAPATTYFSDVAVAASRVYAIAHVGGGFELVELHPPAACR